MKRIIFAIWTIGMLSAGSWGGWTARAAADPLIDARDRAATLADWRAWF